jgi:hypothetical protein
MRVRMHFAYIVAAVLVAVGVSSAAQAEPLRIG